jgi:hypothetical protein
MNSLGMRSARYFMVRAVKYLGVVIGVGLFLVAEMFVVNIGEPDQMEVALNWLITGPIFMALIMNVAYSLYSVSWTDSVVLSMGARRKDIFIGDIIQTIVVLGGAWLFVTIAAIITNQSAMIGFNSIVFAIGFPFGALATVVAHKLQKLGRVVMFVFVFIAAMLGGLAGGLSASGAVISLDWFAGLSAITITGAALIIYLLLEVYIYRLNKTSMVH